MGWMMVVVETTWAQYLIADTSNHRVQFCEVPGFPCGKVAGTGSGASELRHPCDIALSADGDILIVDQRNHRVQLCTLSSLGSECVTVAGGVRGEGPTELDNPSSIAVDANGDYVIVDYANDRVLRCPAASPGVAYDTVVNSTYLNRPSGIAIDGAGDYVVADANNHRIVRCSPWPVRSQCVTVGGTGIRGSDPVELYSPSDVAISADGAYLIADTSNHRIQRCSSTSPGSDCATVVGAGAWGTSELSYPRGVGLDADGALLVADSGNARILRCTEVSVRLVCVTVGAFGGDGDGPTQLLWPRAVVSFVPSTTTGKMTTTTSTSTLTGSVATSPPANAIVSRVGPANYCHLIVSAVLVMTVAEI